MAFISSSQSRATGAPRRRQTSRRRVLWVSGALMVASALVLFGSACSKELPPSLPRTQIYQRFAPRVELVELAISDEAQAERIRSLYIDIEKIFYEQALEAVKNFQGLGLQQGQAVSEEQLREAFGKFRQAEKKAYERYIDVQMQLRKTMTAEQFASLNKLR